MLSARHQIPGAARPAGGPPHRLLPALAGAVLVATGASMLGLAVAAQRHAPQPTPGQAGMITPASPGRAANRPRAAAQTGRAGPPAWHGAVPAGARPLSIAIPAIGVRSRLLAVGLGPGHTIGVPPLDDPPLTNEAAWYRYSPTPGQPGSSVIVGHVDSAASGPSVFFRLGALRPGDRVDITLTTHQVAVFGVTAVRRYVKTRFPTRLVYGPTSYPALRLITCGGSFDPATHSYLANVVGFAVLYSLHP